ncbi:2'-5' RNA ligase family protein [Phycicoccus ginsengisoli]
MSYAVYRTFDVQRVLAAVTGLPAVEPLPLYFDGVAIFRRRRAALVAAPTPELLDRQSAVVAAGTATGADLHRHYLPGQWVPHASLATSVRRQDLGTAATAAFEILPLRAVADRVALVDSSTGQRWDLPAP